MPKVNPLTFEEVSRAISYDPETGKFVWLVSPAKNIKAGSDAGCAKGIRINKKTGEPTRYTYVRFRNFETPAGRLAWLLHYGEWPQGNVLFADGDPSNLRIANLTEGTTSRMVVNSDGIKSRQMDPEVVRGYGLKRFYGMTLAEYGERLVAQKGACAICEKPETAMLHGKVKALSVDHSHKTGANRDLLCSSCNHLLGHAREDRDVLIAAVRYLDKHSGAEKVVTLKEVK